MKPAQRSVTKQRQGGRKVKVVAETAAPTGAVETPAEASALTLDAVCTLRESISLKASLLEQIELGRDVQIDGAAVERIDTAALQLLVAFARSLREAGRTLTWKGEAPEVLRAARQLALTDLLGLNSPAVI